MVQCHSEGFGSSNAHRSPSGRWLVQAPQTDPDVLTFSGAPYTTSGRITALALAPNCDQGHCTLYLAAAGGGIWKTNNALDTSPSQSWNFISASFATNAIGTLVIDPTDPTGNTLYAGTGESHASADSEAGFGIYKTTDGGNTWTHLAAHTDVPAGSGVDCDAVFGVPPGTFGFQTAPAYSGPAFDGRAISSIIIRPEQSECSLRWLYSCRARGQLRLKRRRCESRTRSSPLRNMEVNRWRSKLHALKLPRCLPQPNAAG